jgi:hypothetical protein
VILDDHIGNGITKYEFISNRCGGVNVIVCVEFAAVILELLTNEQPVITEARNVEI